MVLCPRIDSFQSSSTDSLDALHPPIHSEYPTLPHPVHPEQLPPTEPRRSPSRTSSPPPSTAMSETDYDSFTSLPVPTHKSRRPTFTYGRRAGGGSSQSRRVFTSKLDSSSNEDEVVGAIELESTGKREREEEEREADCETSGEEGPSQGSREKVWPCSQPLTRRGTYERVVSR